MLKRIKALLLEFFIIAVGASIVGWLITFLEETE